MAASPSQSSLYKVLGVPKTADDKQIRDAYKAEVVRVHPDKGGSHHEFALLQKAYETLKDSDKRKQYDQELVQKQRARLFRRPPPLTHVKSATGFALQDGELYIFETAPDRLRCKFRHGDIVASGGETGCFLGLGAHETFYWVKQGSPFATPLYSQGMGDDRNVHIVLRATPMRKTSSFCSSPSGSHGGSSSTPSGSGAPRSTPTNRHEDPFASTAPPTSSSFFRHTGASTSSPPPKVTINGTGSEDRIRKMREEILRIEKVRIIEQRMQAVEQDEMERRKVLSEKVTSFFSEHLSMFSETLRRLGWKPKSRIALASASPLSLPRRMSSCSPVRDYIRGKSPLHAASSWSARTQFPSSRETRSHSTCAGGRGSTPMQPSSTAGVTFEQDAGKPPCAPVTAAAAAANAAASEVRRSRTPVHSVRISRSPLRSTVHCPTVGGNLSAASKPPGATAAKDVGCHSTPHVVGHHPSTHVSSTPIRTFVQVPPTIRFRKMLDGEADTSPNHIQ